MAAQNKKPDVVMENGAVYVLRAGTPVYIKTADVCAMTGKSNQWIGQLVSQGTLSKRSTSHGSMFDATATLRAFCDMLAVRTEPEKSETEIKQEAAKSAAEATLKVSKATIAKLQAQELQGKMHRAEDVAAMTEDLIFTIRGMLLALPGRLAVDAADISDPAEVSELIRSEIYTIMEELSQYRYDSKKYEERVRERMRWESAEREDAADESG